MRNLTKKRGKEGTRQQTVLTKTSELQDRLLTTLGLRKEKIEDLGQGDVCHIPLIIHMKYTCLTITRKLGLGACS